MIKLPALLFLLLLLAGEAFSQKLPVPVVTDQLAPAAAVQLKGFVGGKLDASWQNRILAQDVDRLVAPFGNRTETSCWQSEFWGKWFTSAALAYQYKPDPRLRKMLDQAVDGLIATQTPDGY
ncbi:MAG TPA: glycoside hydrolase family 127 protein, partial [Prolixibacteraceae bacterium]|nr:glycoside hydrolase family 127 protein [Prolixibacteraceae bacterium]